MSDLLKNMESLDVGKKLDSFTGVVVHAGRADNGDDLNFAVGSSSGYVLDITNPIGTKEMAAGVLAGLKLRGYQYQPYEAESALLDPAAEIGDNVTVNGTSSIIFNRTLKFNSLMPANIGAPFNEEVNHAFKYEAAIEREFKRESKYTRSRIKQNKDSIQLEVIRASEAESALGARIDLRVNSISLSVSGTDGTSVFKVMDGSTTLSTTRFDISVKAMNVNGQLTASQIAAGAITLGKLAGDAKAKITASGGQIYKSVATNSAPAAPTSWVSDESGDQNKWTRIRPEYSSSYKYLFTAYQRLDADDVYTCTTPKRDKTTTVIDGGNIITGSITADKISVTDLSALNATIGGWSIESRRLAKGGGADDLSRVQINAPASPTDSSNAIAVAYRESTDDAFTTKFSVTYGGKLKCTDVNITGGDLGGAEIKTHSFGGITIPSFGVNEGKLIVPGSFIEALSITAGNIADFAIETAKLAVKSVTDAKVADAINTNLGYAANYHTVATTDNLGTGFPEYFKVGTLRVPTWAYLQGATIAGYACSWKYRVLQDTLGNEHSEWVLTGSQ